MLLIVTFLLGEKKKKKKKHYNLVLNLAATSLSSVIL